MGKLLFILGIIFIFIGFTLCVNIGVAFIVSAFVLIGAAGFISIDD